MNRILLIDIDSKIPNLALMKISAYHKSIGDKVGFGVNDPDKVYASVVFKKNKIDPNFLYMQYPEAEIEIGGSGQDLYKTLPDEIEFLKPDYDLYPNMEYSMGFTTRGCIRNCYFCIVPKKEGMIKVNQHPSEFHDKRFDTCMIMDNNILAAPEKHWKSVFKWFIDNKIKMIEHGMDIRLMTHEKARYIKQIRFAKPLKFAFDNTEDEEMIERGINILKEEGFNVRRNIMVYVYCHDDSMVDDTLYRCRKLKEWRTNPFVMCNIDKPRSRRMKDLQRWANRKALFWSIDFTEYERRRKI